MAVINNNPFGTGNSTILSSTGVGSAYNDASTQLDNFTSGADPYAQLFTQLSESNKASQDNAIATATAKTERDANTLQQQEGQYNAGVETAGVQSGANRYLPEYQAGIVDQAHQTYMTRYQAIDQAEKLAIAQATTAKTEGDAKLLKEKLDHVQALRKAKADALEKAQQMAWERDKFKQQMALQWHQENRIGAAETKANKSNDIATALLDFKSKMQKNGWSGANPDMYKYYSDYLKSTYGAAAILDLNKLMSDEGIDVDYGG